MTQRVIRMLNFKEFITESVECTDRGTEIAAPDQKLLMNNLAKINQDLDAVTEHPFVNSALYVNAVRGTLERYGIILPAASNMQQLSVEGETIYTLGDSGWYIYMVHNLNKEGYAEGYAQIVDEDELDDLAADEAAAPEDVVQPAPSGSAPPRKPWIPPARRDDDSGNDNEYA